MLHQFEIYRNRSVASISPAFVLASHGVGEKVVGFDTHDEPETPVARFDLIV